MATSHETQPRTPRDGGTWPKQNDEKQAAAEMIVRALGGVKSDSLVDAGQKTVLFLKEHRKVLIGEKEFKGTPKPVVPDVGLKDEALARFGLLDGLVKMNLYGIRQGHEPERRAVDLYKAIGHLLDDGMLIAAPILGVVRAVLQRYHPNWDDRMDAVIFDKALEMVQGPDGQSDIDFIIAHGNAQKAEEIRLVSAVEPRPEPVDQTPNPEDELAGPEYDLLDQDEQEEACLYFLNNLEPTEYEPIHTPSDPARRLAFEALRKRAIDLGNEEDFKKSVRNRYERSSEREENRMFWVAAGVGEYIEDMAGYGVWREEPETRICRELIAELVAIDYGGKINKQIERDVRVGDLQELIDTHTPVKVEAEVDEHELTLGYLRELATKAELETLESYTDSLNRAVEALAGTEGVVELEHRLRPTILIPDLHGRRDFLLHVLEAEVDRPDPFGGEATKATVFDLLKAGEVNVVCMGDGLHLEGRDDIVPYEDAKLRRDLVCSLGMMKMIMELKAEFPDSFHYVRGNHDDINYLQMQKWGVMQNALFNKEIRNIFGDELIEGYIRWEQALPLVVVGDGFVVEHAAPGKAFTRQEMAARSEAVFYAMAWADNVRINVTLEDIGITSDADILDQAKKQGLGFTTSLQIVQSILKNLGKEQGRLFIGHRRVDDDLCRQEYMGKMVQINHPTDQIVIIVGPGEVDPPYAAMKVADLGTYLPTFINDSNKEIAKGGAMPPADFDPAEVVEPGALDGVPVGDPPPPVDLGLSPDPITEEQERIDGHEPTVEEQAKAIASEVHEMIDNLQRKFKAAEAALTTDARQTPDELEKSWQVAKDLNTAYTVAWERINNTYNNLPSEMREAVINKKKDGGETKLFQAIGALIGEASKRSNEFSQAVNGWVSMQGVYLEQEVTERLRDSSVSFEDRTKMRNENWSRVIAVFNEVVSMYREIGFWQDVKNVTDYVVPLEILAANDNEAAVSQLFGDVRSRMASEPEVVSRVIEQAKTLSPYQAINFIKTVFAYLDDDHSGRRPSVRSLTKAKIHELSMPIEDCTSEVTLVGLDMAYDREEFQRNGSIRNWLGATGARLFRARAYKMSPSDQLLMLTTFRENLSKYKMNGDYLSRVISQMVGTGERAQFLLARALGIVPKDAWLGDEADDSWRQAADEAIGRILKGEFNLDEDVIKTYKSGRLHEISDMEGQAQEKVDEIEATIFELKKHIDNLQLENEYNRDNIETTVSEIAAYQEKLQAAKNSVEEYEALPFRMQRLSRTHGKTLANYIEDLKRVGPGLERSFMDKVETWNGVQVDGLEAEIRTYYRGTDSLEVKLAYDVEPWKQAQAQINDSIGIVRNFDQRRDVSWQQHLKSGDIGRMVSFGYSGRLNFLDQGMRHYLDKATEIYDRIFAAAGAGLSPMQAAVFYDKVFAYFNMGNQRETLDDAKINEILEPIKAEQGDMTLDRLARSQRDLEYDLSVTTADELAKAVYNEPIEVQANVMHTIARAIVKHGLKKQAETAHPGDGRNREVQATRKAIIKHALGLADSASVQGVIDRIKSGQDIEVNQKVFGKE